MNVEETNRKRLIALIDSFSISLQDVARITGYSRPLISRVFNGSFQANNKFWIKAEEKLTEIISERTKTFFDIEPADIEKIMAFQKIEKKKELKQLQPAIINRRGMHHIWIRLGSQIP